MTEDLLPETPFDAAKPYFTVAIDQEGCIVYSECCADRMSRQTAVTLHAALGQYLARDESEGE